MINKKNILGKKAQMSYLQISMLIISCFAISYLLNSETGLASAAEIPKVCCEKTKNNINCQNDIQDNCDANFKISPTECKDTDYCRLGCCISSQTGICNEKIPKATCSKEEFKESAECSVQECKKGCCILGDNAKWTTEKNCQTEAGYKGIPINFTKEIKSEAQCIFSIQKDKKGACVLSDRSCKYITLEECNARLKIKNPPNTNFYEGKLCSDSQLNTTCKLEKTSEHKGCIEGKEDVYYFDTCGNPDIIAQDCDFFAGSYCGKEGTEYKCKDINCNIDGKKRKNGESWCEYDEVIGKGKDLVGSRHVKHICYMGKEKIELCSDYRNEICVEQSVSYKQGKISQAACRVNNWRSCYNYDTKNETEMIQKCEKNPDCYVYDVNVDSQFHFKLCVPNYPPGFELNIDEDKLMEEDYHSSAESICSIASQQCTVVKVCTIFGCKIKVNKQCLTKKFTEQMNELCVSLGDCGGYINYNGDVTDSGYIITSDGDIPPRLSNTDILALKNKAGEKPAKPGDISFLGVNGEPEDLAGVTESQGNLSSLEKELQGLSGALGSSLLIKILSENSRNSLSNSNIAPSAVNFAGFANSFATIQSGVIVDYKLSKILGVPRESFIAGSIGGILGSLLFGIIPGIIIGLILFFLFFGKVKYIHVNFKCLPWQPPLKGNCDACNKESDFPCSDYRCTSLGENCKLINKGTGDELCESMSLNYSIPQIKPWDGKLENTTIFTLPSKGYEYYNVNDDGFEIVNSTNKGCVDAFSSVNFGIETLNVDGSSQKTVCKFDMNASSLYEKMADYFDELHPNSFLPVHARSLFFPSPEALKNKYNLTQEEIKKLGEFKFYIRCKNLMGSENPVPFEIKTCVNPGPDLTAPMIIRTEPVNGAYVKYGSEEQNLKIYTNEPANCKWSKGDKKYPEMENAFACNNDLENYTIYGWGCDTKLTNLKNNTKFYIRCQDLSENKNNMSESYVYELSVSNSELKIKNIIPANGGEIVAGVDPAEVMLRLETEGGAKNGKSVCEWEGNGFSDRFTETNSSFHSYDLKYATRGRYSLNFKCEDIAGNIAGASSSFNVIVDDLGPRITRVYNDGGLKISTNENAECRYDFNRKFIFDNASAMNGNELEHVAEWKIADYYIQCKDGFGNKGSITAFKTY